jgi:uncharacterized protein involved in exopolysaccharide biosynthesis
MEEQVKSVMLANVREEFALRVIDPAVVPELDKEVRPQRVLIMVIGIILGLVLGALLAFVRERITGSRP